MKDHFISQITTSQIKIKCKKLTLLGVWVDFNIDMTWRVTKIEEVTVKIFFLKKMTSKIK